MNEDVLAKLDVLTHQHPDRLLYTFLDVNGKETEKYTYAGFAKRVAVIASNLLAMNKFKNGDRLLLAYPAGLEMIAAFFGCVKAGFIPVPAYPPSSSSFQASLQKIGYIVKDCNARAVLTGKDYYWSFQINAERNKINEKELHKWIPEQVQWINTDTFFSELPVNYPVKPNEIFFLQYTSGSTSDPKGVMVSHKNILYNCNLVSDHLPVCVSWLPQYHDMGLIGYYIFCALQSGTTYGLAPFDFIQRPALWLEIINRYRCTASSAPNFAYEYILLPGKIPEGLFENLDLSCLKFLMTAAEPVRPEVYEAFLNYFAPYGLLPESYFAAYGLAENTLAVTNYGHSSVAIEKEALKMGTVKEVSYKTGTNDTVRIMSCGTFLGDNDVRIVHPQNAISLPEGKVGEVWITGESKCLGYWEKPELTTHYFNATINDGIGEKCSYLRTGDLGFIWKNELYICGRLKDMIIIRGLNYYPQDIERLVESSSDKIRKTCVAAFGIEEEGKEKLVVVAGVKSLKHLPDAQLAANAIRNHLGINLDYISYMLARDVPKTSSGKLMRASIKQGWETHCLPLIETFTLTHTDRKEKITKREDVLFDEVKLKYGLKGDEKRKLGDTLDSIDLVMLMHEIQERIALKGAKKLSKKIDIKLVQEINICDLFELSKELEEASGFAVQRLKKMLLKIQEQYQEAEYSLMKNDCNFNAMSQVYKSKSEEPATLLTGGTGFLGPFILERLLALSSGNIYVLIRASSEVHAMERIVDAQKKAFGETYALPLNFYDRVIPICGNLDQQSLGLSKASYKNLSTKVTDIFHNGALVNYLYTYEKMREINVKGTHSLVEFALNGTSKLFNHISTTFIFGWAVKNVLLEKSCNDDIKLLDFGYSQSKWVAEKIVSDAMQKGLQARIFRPALISPAVDGSGYNFDIAIRLLAFMIKYGIGVTAGNQVSFLPADVVANNIVAISKLPESINNTFHVTRDTYNTMSDVTNLISTITGVQFNNYSLKDFVPVVINSCTREDILYPLKDFLVRSADKINAMEFKRYDNTTYQYFRDQSLNGMKDPDLHQTVNGIIKFLERNNLVNGVYNKS